MKLPHIDTCARQRPMHKHEGRPKTGTPAHDSHYPPPAAPRAFKLVRTFPQMNGRHGHYPAPAPPIKASSAPLAMCTRSNFAQHMRQPLVLPETTSDRPCKHSRPEYANDMGYHHPFGTVLHRRLASSSTNTSAKKRLPSARKTTG